MTNRPEELPRRLGAYELVERIGDGGMGAVYRAIDKRLGIAVAVKVIHEHLRNEPGYLERFRREAHVASLLTSPYIVQVMEFGFDQESYFLVTEYVTGTQLSDVIARGPMDVEKALDIVVQVTLGLVEADIRGVIHRDIKPENIMVTTDGTAKLMDFGIARLSYARGVTQPGLYVGTVAYSAPEQFRGQADIRSDIYSLGVVLFQMLSGSMPFQASTIGEMMEKHIQEPPPLEKLAHLPKPMVDLIARCLEKNPGARFQRPSDLLSAIETAREAASNPQAAQIDDINLTRMSSAGVMSQHQEPPSDVTAFAGQSAQLPVQVGSPPPDSTVIISRTGAGDAGGRASRQLAEGDVPPWEQGNARKKPPVALFAIAATVLAVVAIGGFFLLAGGGGDDEEPKRVLTGPELLTANKYSVVDIVTTGADGDGGGSGVVWEESKYVITNAHVVTGAGTIKVIDPDDGARSFPARVVALSSCDDVALLEVDRATNLKPAKFGDSKKVSAGETVTALGFPGTISNGPHTAIITNGNVSRIPATFESTGQRDLIQITAPINPGNSGGPLYNQYGEVIGLNSYAARGRQSENYAIAVNEAVEIAKKLKGGKHLDYTGLTLEPNNEEWAYEEDFAYIDGLVVTSVDPGSPADKAEPYPMEYGFLIFELNGNSVETVGQFCDIIRSRKSGETVRVRFGAYDENDEPYNDFQYDLVMP